MRMSSPSQTEVNTDYGWGLGRLRHCQPFHKIEQNDTGVVASIWGEPVENQFPILKLSP